MPQKPPTKQASGEAERKFLAGRFHIDTVVTSHDPRRPNFSENTAIHESLLICRRRTGDNDRSDRLTRFVSLRRMPSTPEEAFEAVEAIRLGDTKKWITVYEQQETQIREGDWRPCQFLDPVLAGAAMHIEQANGLVPLQKQYILGPAGQRIRDAFRPVDDDDGGYRVFWSRSKELRTTMDATPEQRVTDKKTALATRYRKQAGHILLAAKFATDSGRLLAIFSNDAAVGSMWVPVRCWMASLDVEKALCAWFNSTLGALGFLFRRGTKLTNPSFSQAELATLRVPDFKTTDAAFLAAAYERTKDIQVKPWKYAADDDMRDLIDHAAAQTTGIEIETIRDWRSRLSREPTVSNKYAEE